MLIKKMTDIIGPASEKWDVRIAHKTDQLVARGSNTIFLGNSRIKRGIIPAVIDSINPNLRSYNFGETHFAFPYTCKWVDDYLTRLPELEVLVMELTGVGEKVMSLKTWLPYASTSINAVDGWEQEQEMLATLRENFMEVYLSPLPNLNKLLSKRNTNKVDADLYAGFSPYPRLISQEEDNLSLLLTNKCTQRATLLDTGDTKILTLPLAYRTAIDHLKEQCEEANVRLVFLAPPIFSSEQEVDFYQSLSFYAESKDIPVLIISHPLLFEESYRYDDRHLNYPGAQLYSELLGEALKETLKK
jgi:hypothetical protein